MRFADRRNGIAMLTRRKPIEKLRPDRASAVLAISRINRARTPRDQKHDSRPHCSCLRHPVHQSRMRAVEIVAM